jgi:hypothetical protein
MKDHPGQVPYSDKANLMAARGQIGRGNCCSTKITRRAMYSRWQAGLSRPLEGRLSAIKEDTWKPDPNYKQNQQPTPSKNFDDLDSDVPF